ncbi:C40 family peptidase [Aliiroseovarius sp. YM-037]|uniref:C40 family peptidase n=1 Tax=Aliiroseovarius sp. YM-037 TaxID=3341728 RepID=UPI003A812B78
MDRRNTPANARIAATRLKGEVDAPRYSDGEVGQIAVPVADLLREPNGARDRQVLLGECVTIYEVHDGWAFVEAAKDGYVGYVDARSVGEAKDATHWISAPATHVYSGPNLKTPDRMALPFGSRVRVTDTADGYCQTAHGFVPTQHLSPVSHRLDDPVAVAALFLGTPYLWGGNSIWGIDCSGLVQAALIACGIPCPGDSDLQETEVGEGLADDAPLRPGDLLFWNGHVAMVVDDTRLIHANAHAMAVSYEGIDAAIARIEKQGEGPVTSRRRPR